MSESDKKILRNFLLGFILFCIFLEAIFYVGSFITLSLKEYQNKKNLFSDDEYRILCIGESITLGVKEYSYPEELEKILHQKFWGKNIEVINLGVAGARVEYFQSKLEDWIELYDPQMVISMIGLGEQIKESNQNQSKLRNEKSVWDKIRLVILYHQMKLNIVKKYFSKDNGKDLGLQKVKNKGDGLFLEFEDALEQMPSNFQKAYQFAQEADKAKRSYVAKKIYGKLLEGNNPEVINKYLTRRLDVILGRIEGLNSFLGRFKNAPKEYQQKYNLAMFLARNKKYLEAEYLLKDLIKQDLDDILTYDIRRRLGEIFEVQGKYRDYAMNMQGLPTHSWGHKWIEQVCSDKKFVSILTKSFLGVAQKRPLEDSIYFYLSDCYSYLGKENIANMFYQKGRDVSQQGSNMNFKRQYLKLTDFLVSHDVKPVYLQYPMSNFNVLFSLFKEDKNKNEIIFVDNEKIFLDAVAQKGRDVYFTSRDYGNTGHLTKLGAQLLAQNVARSIEEYFLKGENSY